MRNFVKSVVVGITLLLVASTAFAVPITGDVSVIGNRTIAFDPMTATTLPTISGTVWDADGALSALSGQLITFNSFNFSTPSTPVANPLWTLSGFSFILERLDLVQRYERQLVLNGVGALSGPAGFQATSGMWSLTLDTNSNRTRFGFSSNTSATPAPVPEPGTLLLLGSGLVGLAYLKRRKNP